MFCCDALEAFVKVVYGHLVNDLEHILLYKKIWSDAKKFIHLQCFHKYSTSAVKTFHIITIVFHYIIQWSLLKHYPSITGAHRRHVVVDKDLNEHIRFWLYFSLL